eukprot:TRINITY_DN2083_c0_g1_i1.p1 TRINITY_DN2083_c0_g1~~TRINITY_DN2083_c0_g1_i1.p1  ORF type:complete len:185 (-),score=31.25 TRINITY_DN2083_c0_g1_i1:55-609(-)
MNLSDPNSNSVIQLYRRLILEIGQGRTDWVVWTELLRNLKKFATYSNVHLKQVISQPIIPHVVRYVQSQPHDLPPSLTLSDEDEEASLVLEGRRLLEGSLKKRLLDGSATSPGRGSKIQRTDDPFGTSALQQKTRETLDIITENISALVQLLQSTTDDRSREALPYVSSIQQTASLVNQILRFG